MPQDGTVSTTADAAPYEALLLVSFGGPERGEDVIPFLENVTRGRAIPPERLLQVAEHYFARGGLSPINAQNRALVEAIQSDLAAHGVDLPVYWGNRNWDPFLRDALACMADDGISRAAAIFTSAYSSYSGCRQYREDLARAAEAVGARAPRIDKVRHYFNHPGFVEAMIANTVTAVDDLPSSEAADAELVFVTHSIPTTMNEASGPAGRAYVAQHEEVARLVADGVAHATGRVHASTLVYCSRSGPTTQPWLEPDINDHVIALAARGTPAAVFVPIGFVSDHMEILYDIDTEAVATAERVGLFCTRAATVGVDPRFVSALRELVLERASAERGLAPLRPVVGSLGPSHDNCPRGCCPNARGYRRTLCGAD